MSEFSLVSQWHITAPLDEVWNALIDIDHWPNWWKFVRSVNNKESTKIYGRFNNKIIYWDTRLPYKLIVELKIIHFKPLKKIQVLVDGDLIGTGYCEFTCHSCFTQIDFLWQVRTTKGWMNRLSRILGAIFEWNHNQVMKAGEIGLNKHFTTLKNHVIS